jgi:hypothetical protein
LADEIAFQRHVAGSVAGDLSVRHQPPTRSSTRISRPESPPDPVYSYGAELKV